jgi:uncharacterized protein
VPDLFWRFDPDASVIKAERAITDLNACGVQMFTNVKGKPLSASEFHQIFEVAAAT